MKTNMKTKVFCLLCSALATSGTLAQADQYSITIPAGSCALIANQLNNDGNTLNAVLGVVPGGTSSSAAGTQVLKFDCQTQAFSLYYFRTNVISGGCPLGGCGWRSSA